MKYLFIYSLFCFPFQIMVSSLFLKLVQYLLTSSSLSSHPFYVSYIVHSATCFRRQFLCKVWPIQSAFRVFTLFRKFLPSLTQCNTFSFFTSVQRIFSRLLQHHVSKFSGYFLSNFLSVQVSHTTKLCSWFIISLFSSLNLSIICWWKRFFFLWNVAFAIKILDLFSHIHLSSFVAIH